MKLENAKCKLSWMLLAAEERCGKLVNLHFDDCPPCSSDGEVRVECMKKVALFEEDFESILNRKVA